jgi:hypothetical protein
MSLFSLGHQVLLNHNVLLSKYISLYQTFLHHFFQRVATDDDIQDWIKTVEDASNKAAAEVFGLPSQASRVQGRAKAHATIQHVREHDAAYAEGRWVLAGRAQRMFWGLVALLS